MRPTTVLPTVYYFAHTGFTYDLHRLGSGGWGSCRMRLYLRLALEWYGYAVHHTLPYFIQCINIINTVRKHDRAVG